MFPVGSDLVQGVGVSNVQEVLGIVEGHQSLDVAGAHLQCKAHLQVAGCVDDFCEVVKCQSHLSTGKKRTVDETSYGDNAARLCSTAQHAPNPIPLAVAAIIILFTPLLIYFYVPCVCISMPLTIRLLYSKADMITFNMHNNLSACYAREDKTGTDKRVHKC